MEFIDDNEWTPIHTLPGYECCIEYYINSKGEIKSTKGKSEKVLKQRKNKNGYMQVNLTQRIGRKKTITVAVHTLVALAFLKPPLSLPVEQSHVAGFVMSMVRKITTSLVILNGLK